MTVFFALPGLRAQAFAADGAADSMFGLPASSASPTEVVGSLPYSNQWISERIDSIIYVTYNSARLGSRTMTVGQYVSDFGGAGLAFPALDFFSHLVSFAGPESRSPARDFSLWGRLSFGLAARNGRLSATESPIDSTVESNSLMIFTARVGALLGYDHLNWVKPYAGMEIDPYYFRDTADISAAEQQGEQFCYGPVIGAHFPVLFSGRASLLAEYHRSMPASGTGQIFGTSNNYTAGMGLTF